MKTPERFETEQEVVSHWVKRFKTDIGAAPGAAPAQPQSSHRLRGKQPFTSLLSVNQAITQQITEVKNTGLYEKCSANLRKVSLTAGSMFSDSICANVWSQNFQEVVNAPEHGQLMFGLKWRFHCDNDSSAALPWIARVSAAMGEKVAIFKTVESMRNRHAFCVVANKRISIPTVDILVAAPECCGFCNLSELATSNPFETEGTRTYENWQALTKWVESRTSAARPKVIVMESLKRMGGDALKAIQNGEEIPAGDNTAYKTAVEFFSKHGYKDLSAFVNADDNNELQMRGRTYCSFHDMITVTAPLDTQFFYKVLRAQELPPPPIAAYFRSSQAYRMCPWKVHRKPRKVTKCVAEDAKARAAYKACGEPYPPKKEWSSPATWCLPEGAYVDVAGLNRREVEIAYWHSRTYKHPHQVYLKAVVPHWKKCFQTPVPVLPRGNLPKTLEEKYPFTG